MIPGIGIGMNYISPVVFNTFTAEYQKVLDVSGAAGAVMPSYAQQKNQNQVIQSEKDAGLWILNDIFYLTANNGSADFGIYNYRNASLFALQRVSSPTFTINRGFKGDGVSSFLRTGYTPDGTMNYKLNDSHRCAWLYTVDANSIPIDGLDGNNGNRMVTVNSSVQRINGTANLNAAVNLGTTAGLKTIIRTDATNVMLYDGKTQFARTSASSALDNLPQCILLSNLTYGASGFSFYSMGKALTQAQLNSRVDILTTYINTLT